MGGAAQGACRDTLISTRLPIPDTTSTTRRIRGQGDYHRLAMAAQATSAHSQPCLSPQAVPVSLSLRHRQLCSPMEALLSACVLLCSGAAEIRMTAAGVEGWRARCGMSLE